MRTPARRWFALLGVRVVVAVQLPQQVRGANEILPALQSPASICIYAVRNPQPMPVVRMVHVLGEPSARHVAVSSGSWTEAYGQHDFVRGGLFSISSVYFGQQLRIQPCK